MIELNNMNMVEGDILEEGGLIFKMSGDLINWIAWVKSTSSFKKEDSYLNKTI